MNPDEEQTVLFTIIPRGITLDNGPCPVSVIVSPRLRGDNKLGAFPDWLKWTQRLREQGLTGEEALERIADLRRHDPYLAGQRSPQTLAQRKMILEWQPLQR